MRKLLITLCSGVLLIGGMSYHAMAEDKAGTKTVEGELVDLHCYAGSGAKGDGHAKCGGACAASGIPVAVLVDGKAWTLATNPVPLAGEVSKQVRVTGTPKPDTMTFLPDKVEVKDGDGWKEVALKDTHHK